MSRDLKESGSAGSKDRMRKMVKKRYESTGLRGSVMDGFDRYESTSYSKKGKYKGGLDKHIKRKFVDDDGIEGGSGKWTPTGENTYTQYKPLRKPVESKNQFGATVITYGKGKEISEKKYNRIKKRKNKKYKNTEL